jgi:iron complex transport system substrate-binding protein
MHLLDQETKSAPGRHRAPRHASSAQQSNHLGRHLESNHSRPKVYFEEWEQPLISGIGWVSELIEIAGGEDVFPDLALQKAAKDRIVSPEAVIAAAPDAILASWCGKKVVPEKIRQRPGWSKIPAVRTNRIVEIKSPLILQPGPAALTDGLNAILSALGRAN